ncbi:MAG: hypothetical protein MUE51_02105 [Thermoleophilia bacterium]|jgi:hypothetical protein|nr:hypothetical protein [Thermoleophilia bacterium]
MRRRPPETVEVSCPTCGLIAELTRPRGARIPRLCACPAPEAVTPSTRPRVCMSCDTVLSRYNQGQECGACRVARERAGG